MQSEDSVFHKVQFKVQLRDRKCVRVQRFKINEQVVTLYLKQKTAAPHVMDIKETYRMFMT